VAVLGTKQVFTEEIKEGVVILTNKNTKIYIFLKLKINKLKY